MELTQVNLVVSDLEASRRFYVAVLGCQFRAISGGEDESTRAWLPVEGSLPLAIHSSDFASWWDPGSPGTAAGSTVLDLDVDTADEQDRVLARAVEHGGAVARPAEDMPWGERFAVMTDPDRYRWGIKTSTR
jgi:uncharacterized glyoxalase superfamily protein PhnB